MRTVLAWLVELIGGPLETKVYALTPVRTDDRDRVYERDV